MKQKVIKSICDQLAEDLSPSQLKKVNLILSMTF